MTRVLAIDTTAEFGSIAIYSEGAVQEAVLQAPEGYSSVIFQEIAKILDKMNLRLDDIDAFAAASGPGSFTGVRIGLACVKGLAEANSKPVYGVSNLEALARFGTGDRRAVVIDARRGEAYTAMYDSHGNVVIPETVEPLPAFLALLGDQPVLDTPRPLAGMIAKIAAERLANGVPGDPAALDANYVRRSDAELLFKPL